LWGPAAKAQMVQAELEIWFQAGSSAGNDRVGSVVGAWPT
jgi:hypothetical protein